MVKKLGEKSIMTFYSESNFMFFLSRDHKITLYYNLTDLEE